MTAAEPKVVIVVPWRAGDPDRERAWAWCLAWWEQFEWPIFQVNHPAPVPFNRSWCINEGARRAGDWDVLVAIDADVFEENPEQVRHGVASCFETGKLVVPHLVGADLSLQGTRKLLTGRETWRGALAGRRDPCTSRVTIVRRDLFERVGGFDQRFRGWGHEDVAFWASTVPIRGVDQFAGTCYHLWHNPSLRAARPTREWRDGAKLADRYLAAFRNGWPALQRILDERAPQERYDGTQEPGMSDAPMFGATDVMVLTAGRRKYLEQTIASFEERVHGVIGSRVIQDDSGDPEFGKWLADAFPEWTIITTPGKTGFTEAIRSLWYYQLNRNGTGAPYIFHLEEDFTFNMDVDLNDMIKVLEFDSKLAQVALLRGPWAPDEHKAGGIIQQHPSSYQFLDANGIPYIRHRRYFTTNPSLYRRDIMERGWPNVRNSELGFTKKLRARGMMFGFLGDGTPMVTHIGDERVGLGY